ncbi:MAG TPA: hypothetical protein PKI71_13345, partial [Candidatus Rifleibacterium sp.]|nr:hypothetical protein [Candidatus Rifleibacterium sp.]
AVTSSISLLEVCVSYVVDEWKWTRRKATLIIAALIFLMGVPCSLSQGPWADIKLIKGKCILDSVDFVASNVLLPLGGILLCVFIAWVWGLRRVQKISKTDEGKTIITWELEYTDALKEVTNDGQVNFALAPIWVFLIKWLAPVAITIVFIQGIFS